MQALYLLTLQPVAEETSDHNSYGFRPNRGCRDAIGQCFCALAKKYSPRWVLDADIKACFDQIRHEWLLDNILIDKKMLRQWLECGFIKHRKLFPTKAGTPQGGIISPTLANMTLDGLEKVIRKSCLSKKKVNFVRYADDFVSTADRKELIENNIIPAINDFLKPRGLMLSEEKTRIVRIEDGFDFLGQHLRKFGNKLLTVPSKDNVKRFIEKVQKQIKSYAGRKCEELIKRLNPMIRGWACYHRYIQASKVYSYVSTVIYKALWKWAKREHSNKGPKWIKNKYFNLSKRGWVFSCKVKDKNGKYSILTLINPSHIRLLRYIKIRGAANPFNPKYTEYFEMRRRLKNTVPIHSVRLPI